MKKNVCIHAHFYQPPRENPWLNEIELQDSAYPYHDWNEKILAECYAPNTASRILDTNKKIIDIVNNYSKISFNFGPTLLSWIEKHHLDIYIAILEADRKSQISFSGHGSAIAQVYNHIIMPLANSKDKRTQIYWGIKDFEYRFKRYPEGMWLAETAVDLETLDILSEYGIKFTILSPFQAKRVRKLNDKKWIDVSNGKIDPRYPYKCNLPSGRSITLFFYDAPISHDIAFGKLLLNGENFSQRLIKVFPETISEPMISHVATDGETFGHHHRFADMALAYATYYIEKNNLAKITIYAEFLEKYPPENEVEIFENSSWSCAHGVERWQNDCGCTYSTNPNWQQSWRKPLREAMNWLRDQLILVYEQEMSKYFADPWEIRNKFITYLVNPSKQKFDEFIAEHTKNTLSEKDKEKIIKLLKMQKYAMFMFTSCGWFFDEISRIETLQIIQYASRTIQLAKMITNIDLTEGYLKFLEKAKSNIPEFENGRNIYLKFIEPSIVDITRVGAHYAISSLFQTFEKNSKVYCYLVKSKIEKKFELGKYNLIIGKAEIESELTFDKETINYAVAHFGDHNVVGGIKNFMLNEEFELMSKEISEQFIKSNLAEVILLMDKHFGMHNYSIWHLFKDEQRKILNYILENTLNDLETFLSQIYIKHFPTMQVMKNLNVPLPKILRTSTEFVLNSEIKKILEQQEINFERLSKIINELKEWSFEIDKDMLCYKLNNKITSLMEIFQKDPYDVSTLYIIRNLIGLFKKIPLQLDLWKPQNIYFNIAKNMFNTMKENAEANNKLAKEWVDIFSDLQNYMDVRII